MNAAKWLRGRILVVSPHMDDAVLSLGATMAQLSAGGNSVRVLTVFGNDPAWSEPAQRWDRACGFRTAGDAARVRRVEDRRACATVGVEGTVLPFACREYMAEERNQQEIVSAVRRAGDSADVIFIPGWPLMNPDHRWLTSVCMRHLEADRMALYVEQPYACDRLLRAVLRRKAAPTSERPRAVLSLGGLVMGPRWAHGPFDVAAFRAKHRAISAYRSQAQALGPALRTRIALYESLMLGERHTPVTDNRSGSRNP